MAPCEVDDSNFISILPSSPFQPLTSWCHQQTWANNQTPTRNSTKTHWLNNNSSMDRWQIDGLNSTGGWGEVVMMGIVGLKLCSLNNTPLWFKAQSPNANPQTRHITPSLESSFKHWKHVHIDSQVSTFYKQNRFLSFSHWMFGALMYTLLLVESVWETPSLKLFFLCKKTLCTTTMNKSNGERKENRK